MANNNMPKSKKNMTITIILICALLCVVALNVSLFTRNKDSQENTYSSSELSEQQEDKNVIIDEDDENKPNTEGYSSDSVAKDGYIIATKLDTNFVLEIAENDTGKGANLQLWERNAHHAQLFELKETDNGCYQIINMNSGMALAAENGGTADHTNVCQESVGSSDAQYWILIDAGSGYYYIIEKNSGLFLDVDNAWAENGTNIKLFSQNEAYEAQKWLLINE